MLKERKQTGKVSKGNHTKQKFSLEVKLDKQLRMLQNTIVQLEDIEMQRLLNGLVASMLTYPQSQEPGLPKEIKVDDVKMIENDSDLTANQKAMINDVSEKLAYLKDIIGDLDL